MGQILMSKVLSTLCVKIWYSLKKNRLTLPACCQYLHKSGRLSPCLGAIKSSFLLLPAVVSMMPEYSQIRVFSVPEESEFPHFLYKALVRKAIALVVLLAWDLAEPGSVFLFATKVLCVLG